MKMYRDNKELIFQILGGVLILGGIFKDLEYLWITGLIPIVISIILWVNDNIISPIKENNKEIQSLKKDLNTRKEIENIKIQLIEIKNEIKNKK